MPRRNLYLLWFLGLFCLLCYAQSDPLGRVLVQTLRRIQWRYLEEVDDEHLFEGAVDGMVHTLESEFGDRYSMYVHPSLVGEFDEELNQEFGGIGIEVGVDPKTGEFTVLSPIFGSPASLGGIQANDRIVAINGEPIKGLPLSETVKKMRGQIGEPVVIRIQRPKQKHEGEDGKSGEEFDEIDIKISRAMVKIDTVLGDKRDPDGSWDFMLDGPDKIGYLRITSFAENTTEEFRQAIDQLQKAGMKGLIIDLRNNPGGYLDCAVEICDMFVDSGPIVSTRGRSRDLLHWFSDDAKQKLKGKINSKHFETRDQFTATEEGTLDKNFPIIVLINEDSASAAEIVAACLKDHHRAKIIGSRSFGKGTVQEILPVGGGRGMLKLTSASYWRPSGKNINRSKDAKEDEDWGVRPDEGFEITIDPDTLKTIVLTRRRRDVNYSEALSIPDVMLLSEMDEEPAKEEQKSEASQNGSQEKGPSKKKAKKQLPLIDPETPMTDVDPQLRKAVEWIEADLKEKKSK